MNYREGPLCACDENKIREIRALVRSTLDEPEGLGGKTWLEQYDELIVDTVRCAAEKAKAYLDRYPCGVLAVSLLSGITRLWGRGPDFESRRISLVLAEDNILPPEKRHEAERRLAKLHHSPVHALYRQRHDHRPLWICFEKPEQARVESDWRHFDALYQVECPEDAQTYTAIASYIISQATPAHEIIEVLCAVGKYLDVIRYSDKTLVFGVFKRKDMTKALLDAVQAFTITAGRYLWICGFDVEKPPSPYRAVVVSSTETVESDPHWRRWLNTLAAILGEIAAVERSMAIFVHSVKAKAFTIKRDEANWTQMAKTYETQKALFTRQKRLDCEAKKDNTKEGLVKTVKAIRVLLPQIEATLAHKYTVLSMRHYQVPSLRDVLLQYRTIETRDDANKVFSGILRTLGNTLYAHNTLKLGCSKDEYEETRAKYVDTVHLDKFRARSNEVTTHILGLRNSPHTSATHLRLLDAIEVLYRDEPLTVTYQRGKRVNGKRQWEKKDTLPVYSVLEEVRTNAAIKEMLKPPQLHLTHGALHFGNILLDVNDLDDPVFKLIDQGVEIIGRDIANDLSKLLQSCDGLGDFLQEGLFDIKVFKRPMKQEAKEATPRWIINLDVGRGDMKWPLSGGVSGAEVFKFLSVTDQLSYFNTINYNFQRLVRGHLCGAINCMTDPLWFLRAQFTEALNMLTSPPFFLQKDIPASLAFAVTGAMVLTEWCECQKVQAVSPTIRKLVRNTEAEEA